MLDPVKQPENAEKILEPISSIEFDRLIKDEKTREARYCCVGVSGGADSLALVWLLKNWCENRGLSLFALIVNHNLREDSDGEATKVSEWLLKWNVKHAILKREGLPILSGIQSSAREVRYKLMLDWCLKNRFTDLFIAHHQDDQAETFLMRLVRGSSIEGLACMREVSTRRGVRIVRPLLTVPKERLKQTLISIGQHWIEDPSNTNPRFMRTRLRTLRSNLEARKVTNVRLSKLAQSFSVLREILELCCHDFIETDVEIYPEGWARLDTEPLKLLPSVLVEKILTYLLNVIGGKPYPPRFDSLSRLINNLSQEKESGSFTLSNCVVKKEGKYLIFFREERKPVSTLSISRQKSIIWRNIFNCSFTYDHKNNSDELILEPLGEAGWSQIIKKRPELRELSIPYEIKKTLPALFDSRGVLEVPHLNYCRFIRGKNNFGRKQIFRSVRFLQLNER